MSKFKRVISGLVGVAIAASMFTSMPFSVFAEDKTETNNQTYVYDDYEVSYQVTNSWGDTEVVSVTLSNTGDNTIEDWMRYFVQDTMEKQLIWRSAVTSIVPVSLVFCITINGMHHRWKRQ